MMQTLTQIKVLFSDVDGTLTNGQLFYGSSGESLKVFHVKDGAGIKAWMSHGFHFGVISARSSEIITHRMNELGVKDVILNTSDKKSALEAWLKEHNLDWKNLAYIGDDINDLPVMEYASFSAAPADAINSVIKKAGFLCQSPGGMGAVREFIDFLLDSLHPY